MDIATSRFNNEVSEQFLRSLDEAFHTPEQVASHGEDIRDLLTLQRTQLLAHPARAIHRLATEGSRTRRGGVIRQASSCVIITLDNGQAVTVARAGDRVDYPDGSTSSIQPLAQDCGNVAVVGSPLANGDEIIDTPQDGVFIVSREGLPFSVELAAAEA